LLDAAKTIEFSVTKSIFPQVSAGLGQVTSAQFRSLHFPASQILLAGHGVELEHSGATQLLATQIWSPGHPATAQGGATLQFPPSQTWPVGQVINWQPHEPK
jgi:hypothetical protein